MTVQRHKNSCSNLWLRSSSSCFEKKHLFTCPSTSQGKNKQNKTPEITCYKPPQHMGISACSVKCQSSSFHFWSFWQLIPLMCLLPSPSLSSLTSQMPKASTVHYWITKHSNLFALRCQQKQCSDNHVSSKSLYLKKDQKKKTHIA